ncbi:fatty acyl-AMP ligase [Arenibaculum pallidiluteum]|uniref:fatty acyl-AMP ligase n=1 Tax=Arenibaculum pallidiluteum TaxID=2812559 RepID=UPI001A95F9AE|nr:fatty acyl-AMP ligase [Arenibaculum pallidiluteum]
MPSATPTECQLPSRLGDFETLGAALDYAAQGQRGLNFYSGRAELLESLGFGQLRTQARALAGRMLRAGFSKGERIALIAETDGDFVRAFFACIYAGLVPAPMPLPMAFGGRSVYVEHIRGMLTAAGVSGVLAPPVLAEWIAEATEELGLRAVGDLTVFGGGEPDETALPALDPDDVAYIQFSSGSTRFPLGVTVTHRALLSNVRAIARHGLHLRPGDRCVSWLPFYHDMGLVGFLLTPVATQVSADYLPTREFARRPLTWLTLISRSRATVSYGPGFGYQLASRRAAGLAPGTLDLSSWRAAGIGGDMIRPDILAGFSETFAPFGFDSRAFVPSYGMAEATLAISFAPLDRGVEVDRVDIDRLEREHLAAAPADGTARSRDFVLCGPPLPGHDIEIRDAEGRSLGERQVGRIFVRGPSLMRDYWDRPDETHRVLSAEGWLDTGDLGYQIGGSLVITGRAKDLIIVNGRNIWPQDLEWSAERLDGLRSGDAAAFSIDDGTAERIIVLVQCRPLDPEARGALQSAVSGALRAEHGAEAEIVLVPPHSLPQTSSGKLARSRARQLFLAGSFGEVR